MLLTVCEPRFSTMISYSSASPGLTLSLPLSMLTSMSPPDTSVTDTLATLFGGAVSASRAAAVAVAVKVPGAGGRPDNASSKMRTPFGETSPRSQAICEGVTIEQPVGGTSWTDAEKSSVSTSSWAVEGPSFTTRTVNGRLSMPPGSNGSMPAVISTGAWPSKALVWS